MIYDSPYSTSYGKLLNMSKIKDSLVKFEMLYKNDNLNYEFPNGDTYNLMFITGKNQDEIDLPIWNHPFVFDNIEKRKIIAIDVRKYVKKDVEVDLLPMVKDKNNFDYLLVNTMIIGDFLDGNYGTFNSIIKNLTLGFSTLISSTINSIVSLDPVEKVNVEIIANIYANLLFVDGNEDEHLDGIIARVSKTRFSIPVNYKYVVKLLELPGINNQPTCYTDLIANIKAILESKSALIDQSIITNSLSGVWYGHGGGETVLIAMEYMPTWISLMYTNMSNRSYKKSRLAMMLDKNKRNIKPDEVIKTIELYLKEKQIELD